MKIKYENIFIVVIIIFFVIFLIKLHINYNKQQLEDNKRFEEWKGKLWAMQRRKDELDLYAPKTVIRKQFCPGRTIEYRYKYRRRTHYIFQECRVWFKNERTLDTIRIDLASKSTFDSLQIGQSIDTIRFEQIDRILN